MSNIITTDLKKRKTATMQKVPHCRFVDYHPKRISYCLVTKNRLKFLSQFFTMMQALKGPEDELIIVDGNSHDGTREVIEQYRHIVDVFVSEPDLHGVHAINKAILLARGRLIKLLTDDDIYFREGMEQSVIVMEQHPEIDMLLCGGTKEVSGKVWAYSVPPIKNFGGRPEDIIRYKGATGVGQLFRREAVARLGILYPICPNADNAFALEFIKRGGCVRFCRIKVFHHPIYAHSAVVAKKEEHDKDTVRLVKEYCSKGFYLRYRFERIAKPFTMMLWRLYFTCIKTMSLRKEVTSEKKLLWDGEVV